MLIGVISDTHGLLRPQVFEVFNGVDRIIHAGDVGCEDVLTELGAIAPVDAVYGNVDTFPLIEKLPETLLLQVEQVRIFVTHIGGQPEQIQKKWPLGENAQAVVFGHSHAPDMQSHRGTLYFNPGSAGPRRFTLPVSVGLLQVEKTQVSGKIVSLRV